MELKIRELCDQRGIASAYGLAKKSGLKMPTAYRAFANDIKQFTIETLEALCRSLDCTPNDIFGVESGKRKAARGKAASDNESLIDLESGKGRAARVGDMMTFADALTEFERIGKPKSDSSLRRYLQSEKLKAELVGREWEIEKSDFENFINSDFFKNLK